MNSELRKHAALLRFLFEKTEKREISWKTDVFTEGPTFQLGDGKKLSLDSYFHEGEPYERVTITNSATGGSVSFNDSDFPRHYPTFNEYDSWYVLMRTLRERAERQANGIDGIIDDVIQQLGIDISEGDQEEDIPF